MQQGMEKSAFLMKGLSYVPKALKGKMLGLTAFGGATTYGLTAGMPKNKPLKDPRYSL